MADLGLRNCLFFTRSNSAPPPPHSHPPSGREYRSRFASEETVSFCLRVMVGVIILYDYVHPVGAFAKSSKIDVSTRPRPLPTLTAGERRTVNPLRLSPPDERLHQGAEGAASQQRGRPPQRSQVKLLQPSSLFFSSPLVFISPALRRLRSVGGGQLPRTLRPPPTFGNEPCAADSERR